MAVFQIPQFIDMEDKIVGPLTLKQFGFIATTFLLILGLFYILEIWLWLFFATIFISLSLSLAFLKVNGRPLFSYFLSMFSFYWNPRRYFWQHQVIQATVGTLPGTIKKIKDLPQLKMPQIPTVTVTKKPILQPTKLTTGTGLKNIFEKMMTSKNVIQGREKPAAFVRQSRQKYSVLEKSSGERITAKRIDYR